MIRRIVGLAVLVLAAAPSSAEEPGWGTVKGQVVWAGDKVPPRAEVKVQIDKKEAGITQAALLPVRFVPLLHGRVKPAERA